MKIVVFLPPPPTVLRDIMQSFVKEIKKRSIAVLVVDLFNDGSIDMRGISDFQPDMALMIAFYPIFSEGSERYFRAKEDRFFLRKAKIPTVCLYYDNPFFFINNEAVEELKNYSDYYMHFMIDDYWLMQFKNAGYKNSYKILTAVDIELFNPDSNIKVNKRLSFVGGLYIKYMPIKISPLIDEFVSRAISLKIQFMQISMFVIYTNLFKDPSFKPIYELYLNDPNFFWRTIYLYTNKYGTYCLKEYIFRHIKNVEISLYGRHVIIKENIQMLGTLNYGKDLSKMYQESIITLNISAIQLETSLNNRFFDVFASKGFLLSDYKKDMEKVFQGYWQKITYNNIDELNDKIEYYLTHEKERMEVVEQAYHDIVNNHTYTHRFDEILQTFSEHRGFRAAAF